MWCSAGSLNLTPQMQSSCGCAAFAQKLQGCEDPGDGGCEGRCPAGPWLMVSLSFSVGRAVGLQRTVQPAQYASGAAFSEQAEHAWVAAVPLEQLPSWIRR